MLERNSFPPNQVPAGRLNPNITAKNKRKRNKWLILLILAFAAAIVWKWYDTSNISDPFIPDTKIVPAPPITALHPIVLAKQTELITEASKIGITILITDGFRSSEEQDALYARGRTEDGPVVTQVEGGNSYHNYGLAIDFALRTKKGAVIWDMEYDGNKNGQADWMEVVEIAKRLGFSWGGDWENFPDYPHLQMDFGYSIRQLKRGLWPPVE